MKKYENEATVQLLTELRLFSIFSVSFLLNLIEQWPNVEMQIDALNIIMVINLVWRWQKLNADVMHVNPYLANSCSINLTPG